MRTAPGIVLGDQARSELTQCSRSGESRLAQRARIVLLAARGLQNKAIAEELGIGRAQVARWRERYLQGGLAGIARDLPRGAPAAKVDVVRLLDLMEQPAPARGWNSRTLSAALGISPASVSRHLRAIRQPTGLVNRSMTKPASASSTAPLSSSEPRWTRIGGGANLRDTVITLKRERILQEAARLFFERGYLQTSVEAIAEQLGATKPFIYYHFPSKGDILAEICEQSNRDVLAAAESAMSAAGSPRDRFEQFLSEFTKVALLQHQHVAIYFREEISLPDQAAERIRQMRKSISMRLTALLNEGVVSGDFCIEDTRICALVIAGMSSYAFAWYRENGRLNQQEVTQRIVKMALSLVGAQDKDARIGTEFGPASKSQR